MELHSAADRPQGYVVPLGASHPSTALNLNPANHADIMVSPKSGRESTTPTPPLYDRGIAPEPPIPAALPTTPGKRVTAGEAEVAPWPEPIPSDVLVGPLETSSADSGRAQYEMHVDKWQRDQEALGSMVKDAMDADFGEDAGPEPQQAVSEGAKGLEEARLSPIQRFIGAAVSDTTLEERHPD